ncbi:MAG: tRNA (adenosine(37)-N6)-threonylcarbamoyltransferase complex ATPase subunit type 1 TsaE [Candidatus Woykebacteria bacterium GWB1_45_5]|uniref:tRNA threonylcarbamoyladenosine biosynthesis protein TsaE n=2 Tax=Candidatus Woykeibacteriota TaxID=1817899 RepID=A0A1G1W214_9BACT|nr:MAG: tRNA (adenosine(37)-N6)-threonylcarbamoyltransferase complex ATPase subunit type 1 TsaE [Candidatus Woykebacteria bacterium GWA1_44_8]OGY24818.1 MAG: tRNA (adenosine(37)-N6)-threonylcarbamoyltransferase complex ATPase subunit type 1 TsaE [Candidatus Woykebacteria bacterium GWB1_45_5]
MEKVTREFTSKSAEETKSFAKNLAKKIKAGEIVALYGSLGAGKTTFVQGLVAGLGYEGRVFSPTFIFVRPYKLANSKHPPARLRQANRAGKTGNRKQKGKIKTLYHIDLYRVEKETDLKTLGIEEFLADKDAASVIEWPEKIDKILPKETIKIKIEIIGENERRIKVDE